MCGCGPSVDTYGATLNVHDFVQCYAIEGLLVTPRVCRIYRRFTLLLLVLPQTTVFGATLNAKLRGHTLNRQWPKKGSRPTCAPNDLIHRVQSKLKIESTDATEECDF